MKNKSYYIEYRTEHQLFNSGKFRVMKQTANHLEVKNLDLTETKIIPFTEITLIVELI